MATKEVSQGLAVFAKEGKYLTFALRNEEYGLEILRVREIIGLMEITPIPNVPSHVKGVINLRGKVIAVLDLRLKFGMPEIEYTNETCIIVINIDDSIMGIIVDRVCEVLDIMQKNIEPPPNFGPNSKVEFIIGMGKVGDKVKILLNIAKVLSEDATIMHSISA